MKYLKSVFAIVMAMAVLVSFTLADSSEVYASTSISTIYSSVKSKCGSSYPSFSSTNALRTSILNKSVLGVSSSYWSSYTAFKKSTGKQEQVVFICKATSKKNVKKVKTALKKYVSNEKKGQENYYSKTGKSLLSNAKVGSKGKYCYLFIIDTNGNKNAIKGFKASID